MQETPRGIKYPETGDDMSLAQITEEMAQSIDYALSGVTFKAIAAGRVDNVSNTVYKVVELPENLFTDEPLVLASSYGSRAAIALVRNITTEQFEIVSATNNTSYNWIAIQPE